MSTATSALDNSSPPLICAPRSLPLFSRKFLTCESASRRSTRAPSRRLFGTVSLFAVASFLSPSPSPLPRPVHPACSLLVSSLDPLRASGGSRSTWVLPQSHSTRQQSSLPPPRD
eukprot:1897529-Rhodomonas_salina.2